MTSPSLSSSSSSRRTLRHSQTAERSSLHFLGLPGVFSWPLNLILFRHPGQYHLGWLYSELILIGSLTASLDSLQRKLVFTAFFLSPLYQHIHRIHPPLLLYSWPTKNHEKHRLSWRSAPDEAKKLQTLKTIKLENFWKESVTDLCPPNLPRHIKSALTGRGSKTNVALGLTSEDRDDCFSIQVTCVTSDLTSHICSWNIRLSFSISSAISPPLNSVRIMPCILAFSFFSFSIFALQRSKVMLKSQHKKMWSKQQTEEKKK